MKHATFVVSLALFASGCETMSMSGPPPISPSALLDLGDWRHSTPAAELAYFQGVVASRFTIGAPLSSATADLRRNDFTCAVNNDPGSRGVPPTQICRKTITADNCTATWQVHLFDTHGDGQLARSRALFDRRCGNEGLLGGPS